MLDGGTVGRVGGRGGVVVVAAEVRRLAKVVTYSPVGRSNQRRDHLHK